MSAEVALKIILAPVLFVLGLVYAAIMLVRNICYDLGWLKSFRVGSRVISVGNITAGGTGKTPITAFLAQAFGTSAIVSRGYLGTYAEPFAQVNSEIKNASEIFGDEPTWFANALPGTPVWVGPDKVSASKALIAVHPNVDLIFADDAFQHRRLKRDLDIVVIDATVSLFDYLPLPLGRGREDFYLGIRRADILVLNKVNLAKPKRVARMRKILAFLKAGRTLLIEASARIELFTYLNSSRAVLAADLKAKSLFLVSGIARPEQFLKLVSDSTGALVKGHLKLKDHSRYGNEVISEIENLAAKAGAHYIVVTEKDAVNCAGLISKRRSSSASLNSQLRSSWMQFVLGFLGKIFAFIIAYAPAPVRRALGDIVGFLWFDVLKIRRKVAIENISLAYPEKSQAEVLEIARGSMSNMGRTIVEFAQFPFFEREKIPHFFVYEGFENVTDALKKKKGILFLSMHLGNGDFAVAASSLMGFKLNLISKRFKSKWLDNLWFGMRAKHGTKFISPEKSSFDILRALGRNEIVIFVLDQFMGPPVGVRTRFFGRETGTAMGLALVHLRTEAPLILTYTYRRPDNKMVVVFEKEISVKDLGLDPQSPDRANTVAVLTQKYTDKIEQIVRQHPEQWMWIHRRWKDFVDAPKV